MNGHQQAVPDLPALHSQVFRALADAVLITDLQGRILDCNHAAEVMFATPRDLMLGHTADQLGGSPMGAVPAEVVLKALQEQGFWAGDVPLPGVVGGIAATRVFPVQDHTGQVIGFAGVNREVSAERQTANRLADSERRWRSMLDVAPTGLALVGLDGRFQHVNNALCKIVGYQAEQLTGMAFHEITHPEDLDEDLSLVNRLLSGDLDRYTLEKRYVHAHGHAVHVHVSVAVIRDPLTGNPEQFVAAVENTTARRQAAQRLASIIEGASDAFVGIAQAGYVTEWNRAAEKAFGWRRDEAIGRPLTDLIIPPEFRQAHVDGLGRMRRGGRGRILGQPVELMAQTKTGTLLPVELTVWQDGVAGEFYAFIRDVTERARTAVRHDQVAAAQLAIAKIELSPAKVMQAICDHAQALTGADAACVELLEDDHLVYRAVTQTAASTLGMRLPVHGHLDGLAVMQRQPMICQDSQADERVDAAVSRRIGVRSMVAVPLHSSDESVPGVVKVWSARPGHFSDENISTLALLAAPFGAAMANAWQLEASSRHALTDPLTGLGNRSFSEVELRQAVQRTQRRSDRYLALMFMDLDGFKPVNDTLGHAAGDELLRLVGDRLRATLRHSDIAARYGGDEFVAICEDFADVEDVAVFAERLLSAISGTYTLDSDALNGAQATGDEVRVPIGASIGVAVTCDALDPALLLHVADQAMYQAKKAGGRRYVIQDATAVRLPRPALATHDME